MQVRERVTLSGYLAQFVAVLRYEDLPAEVAARARMALLDTLGAALGGIGTTEGERVLAALGVCAPGYLAGRAEYDDAFVHDPAVRDLAARVDLVEGPGFEEDTLKAVEIETADGRRLTASREFARGHARNPLSAEDLDAKFMGLAAPVLGDRAAERVHAIVGAIEEERTLAPLVQALTPAR